MTHPVEKIDFGHVVRRVSGVSDQQRDQAAVGVQRVETLGAGQGRIVGLKKRKKKLSAIAQLAQGRCSQDAMMLAITFTRSPRERMH